MKDKCSHNQRPCPRSLSLTLEQMSLSAANFLVQPTFSFSTGGALMLREENDLSVAAQAAQSNSQRQSARFRLQLPHC